MIAKTNVKKFLSIAFSVLIFIAVMQKVSLADAYKTLGNVSNAIVLLAFVVNVVGAVFLNTAQIYFQLRDKLNSKRKASFFMELLSIDFIIRYYSLVMPTAATAFLRWYYQGKVGVNKTLSGVAVVINKLLNLMFVFLFSALAFFFINQDEIKNLDIDVDFVALALILAAIFVFALVLLFESRRGAEIIKGISSRCHSLKGRLIQKWLGRVIDSANEYALAKANETILGTLKNVGLLLIWPFSSFVIVAYSQLLVMHGLGLSIGMLEALLLRSVVLLALMLPFSLAGIGLREVGVIGVLTFVYNVPSSDALAVSLILFIFQMLISFIGFILSFKGVAGNQVKDA